MNNVETLEKLLKNELSATETYQQALDKFKADVGLNQAMCLTPIYQEHKDAVTRLQSQIRELGGTPAEDSGAWGSWAEMVLGGATLLGKESVLKALLEGEKNGAEDYEEALQDAQLSSDPRALIKSRLLPAQHAHIRALDRLLDTDAA